MDFSFDTEHAKAYGVDEAIVIKTMVFWITKNKTEGRHFFDGHTWTFNTVEAWSAVFEFWTPKQMRRILESLVSQGVLLVGNYNKRPMDRTLWYAFAEESMFLSGKILLTKWANENDQMGKAIPDTNPDTYPVHEEKNPQTPKEASPDLFTELPATEPTKTNKAEETAKAVLEYLNEKTDSRFRTFKGCGLLGLIRGGRTMDDFKAVIDLKVLEWAEDPKMSAYLTPQTLFRAGNFDKYLAMAEKAKSSGGTGLALYLDPDQKALAKALESAFLSHIPSGFPSPGHEREAIGWLVSAIWKQWPQDAFTAAEALVTSFYGLTQTGNTFMRSQPFLPSRMKALYLDVVKACEAAAPPAYDAHREAIMRDLEGAGT